jgi:tRNA-specific 2-thiouridylase
MGHFRKGRVLVAMSGGVDSSVAAILLHQQGYEVIGVTMKTWDYATSTAGGKKERGCCNLDSINEAREVAVHYGFPHYVLDIREAFTQNVIQHFVNEYLAGRTPNPCVLCNTHIKWDYLLKRADLLYCDYIATGHYARIREERGRYILYRSVDEHKDQTYVLWGLEQSVLERTLFPLGNYHKSEVRQMAYAFGFTNLAKKKDSYEICFVPEGDYRDFLRLRSERVRQMGEGVFVLTDGTVVGKHPGYTHFTIGQRRGLPPLGKPHYVVEIRPQTNEVVIGPETALYRSRMLVTGVNLIKYEMLPEEGLEAITKIRYKHEGTFSRIFPHPEGVEVHFYEPVRAITPGQAAVFYEGHDVIGGGWIQKVIHD